MTHTNIILYSIFLLFFLNLSHSSIGQDYKPIILKSPTQTIKLEQKSYVYSSPKNLKPLEVLQQIQNKQLIEYSTKSLSYGFSQDYFWVLFKLQNNIPDSIDLLLEINNPHIDSLAFYQIFPNQNTAQLIGVAGDRRKFYERAIDYRNPLFPLKLKSRSDGLFLLKIDKRNASVSFPATLYDTHSFNKKSKNDELFYLMYFGGVLFITIFTLILGFIIKNTRLSLYGLYVGCMGFYLFVGLGFGFQYFYPESSSINNYIRTQLAVFLFISFVLFSSRYLRLKKLNKISYQTFNILAIVGFVLFLISILFQNFVFENIVIFLKIFYLLIVLSVIPAVFSIIKTIKKNPFQVYTFIGAMLFVFLGSLLYLLVEFGVINEQNIPYNPILLGSIGELFVFSASFIVEIKNINETKNRLLVIHSKKQEDLMEAYIKGSEQESNRISQELHDNIGSRLALAKNLLKKKDSNKEDLSQNLDDIYNEVRTISNKLSPNQIHLLGFMSSVESLLETFHESTKINVNYYADEDIELSFDASLQCFRVIQECLQNIQKHAKATHIDFQILKNSDGIVITIDDNGIGFDMQNTPSQGNGINNMRTRMEAIHGKFEISSTLGKGSYIVLNIPV